MYIMTGATGHIGNNVLRTFIDHQIPCKVLLRKLGPALEGLTFDYAIGDIFDITFLAAHVQAGDTFIHVAGVIDLTKKNRQASEDTNVKGSKIIADFCHTHHVRLIYVSSVDAINKPVNGDPIYEPTHFDIAKIKSHYAKSKATGTAYVLDLMNNQQLQGAIVYPSAVIGIHDYKPSAAGIQLIKAAKRRILLYIKGGYNFIDVRDTALAIYKIAVNQKSGGYILAGHEVTIKDFYQTIASVSQRKKFLVYVPAFIARASTWFLINVSKVMIDAIQENYHYVNDKMIQDLDIIPRPFTETVSDTLHWFDENPIQLQ